MGRKLDSQKLRALMDKAKLGPTELAAEMVDLRKKREIRHTVSQRSIETYLEETRSVHDSTLHALAGALGVESEELLAKAPQLPDTTSDVSENGLQGRASRFGSFWVVSGFGFLCCVLASLLVIGLGGRGESGTEFTNLVLKDGFDDDAFTKRSWRVSLPATFPADPAMAPSVQVESGLLILANCGYVVSKRDFANGVSVQLDWVWTLRRLRLFDRVCATFTVRMLEHSEKLGERIKNGRWLPPVLVNRGSVGESQQEANGLDEVACAGSHGEVDGVEVGLAVEAAKQVLLGVEIGLALAAARTDEAELSATGLMRPVESG